jgi:phosphohistidine phosphatase SixA
LTLYLMRHGRAERREEFSEKGMSDLLRPLTKEGVLRTHKVAKALRKILRDSKPERQIEWIAASPAVRSQQTAEIVAEVLQLNDIFTWSELLPNAPEPVVSKKLASFSSRAGICVGHEPQLSRLSALLMCSVNPAFSKKKGQKDIVNSSPLASAEPVPLIQYKKAGIGCFELMRTGAQLSYRLEWLVSPAVLTNS